MAQRRTHIRLKRVDADTTEVSVLISHPMETGQRVNPQTQEKIPPHFVQKLTFLHNGREVAVMDLAQGVSKDPLIAVRIARAVKGDTIGVRWSDNLGGKDSEEITVTDNV
jgi:sulfur-oxidizing protein SoxZ